ncbi:uncharacterized protein LOC134820475 [Bolinopsis microptera]|uniref:uncharacterized protein LOC134820475 n=1 Tax=Bolinopsis microptera TaxID=2820187 RepID=UPI003079BF5B
MCRTCKAENPKWSKGVRVPVKDLPLFFASQPSWNFEQKIYGHNVVVSERARPTLTGRLGCHDLDGVVHRRQDHFLAREIFHCPGKKYNCSPRTACTGRRRHCYGLCKVTVYSANKDVAIVQFAGTHGTGALQRRVWPYNQYETVSDSPPRDMSKKESKMRAIFGSPTKEEMNWNKVNRPKVQEDLSAFKQLPKQTPFIKDENIDLNSYYQPRMQNIYTTQQQQQPLQCSTMLYHSPPSYTVDQMLSPEISPEDQLKQNQMMSACSQLSPYTFYQQPLPFPNNNNQAPQSPQNFWNNSGFVMSQHMPMTPPQIKSEKLESDYIPTLSEVNCKLDDLEPSFYDMSPSEPNSKRRRLDTQPQQHLYQPQQIQPCPTDQITNMADIWRPYLHPNEYCDNMLPQIKLDNSLFSEPMTPQDNLISFMLKGPEEPNNHIVRDSQKLLANMNMSSGLQLTKL